MDIHTHRMIKNKDIKDTGKLIPLVSASSPACKFFLPLNEVDLSPADNVFTDLVTGDTLTFVDADNAYVAGGSIKLAAIGKSLVGGGGWHHPQGNDFMFGMVINSPTTWNSLIYKGDNATGASITIERISSTSVNATISHDGGTTVLTANIPNGVSTTTDQIFAIVREGDNLYLVSDTTKSDPVAIPEAFNTAFKAAAFSNVISIDGPFENTPIFGIFDYVFAGDLPSDHMAKLAEIKTAFINNRKVLPVDYLVTE